MSNELPQSIRRLPPKQQLDITTADKFAKWMKKLTDTLRTEMNMAQTRHTDQANESRSSAPTFQKDDQV
jgi:hypothetical protein